jgi:hypothetical protein
MREFMTTPQPATEQTVALVRYQMYVNGQRVDSTSDEFFESDDLYLGS